MADLELLVIPLDEFESMRLCDLDGLDQAAAGEKMGVSRGTVQRLLESGRRKLLQAIVDKQAIQIGEGAENESDKINCSH
jgi:predicted DNA-binding protein (UPF0251 family)